MLLRTFRSKLLLHSMVMLAFSCIPFILGMYQKPAPLMLLLLLIWPLASFFSPLRLALKGAPWYLAMAPVPVFLVLPAFVLLTPSAMRYLGVYLLLDALMAVCGALFGSWRNAVRGRRMKGSGLGLRG